MMFGHLWMGEDTRVLVELNDDGKERTIRLRFEDLNHLNVWGPKVSAPNLIQALQEAEVWRDPRAAV